MASKEIEKQKQEQKERILKGELGNYISSVVAPKGDIDRRAKLAYSFQNKDYRFVTS